MNPIKRMKHLIRHLSRVADSSAKFSRPSPSTRAASVDYIYGGSGGGDATAGAVLSNAQRFLLERYLPKQGIEFTRMVKFASTLISSGSIMGCLSVGILGVAAVRTCNRWKLWYHQREPVHRPDEPVVDDETEDADEIPDGELCVICVTRRRIPAFIPCGHVVCCRQCALTVERALNPMRVYYS